MAKKILPKTQARPNGRKGTLDFCFEDEEHRHLANQMEQILRGMSKAQLRFFIHFFKKHDYRDPLPTFILRRFAQLSRNTVPLAQEHRVANVVVLHPSH